MRWLRGRDNPDVELPGRDRRAVRHDPPLPHDPATGSGSHVVVVGGGIAGLSAAVVLAERGLDVTVLEGRESLGGRLRSWPVTVAGTDDATMSRGFHAFFRQYYNLRSILRRTDPLLRRLRPLADYPLVHADGYRDSFAGIPRTPPWSIVTFAARSRSFPFSQLVRVDLRRALDLLRVRYPASFADYDGRSAADVLDDLRFPSAARHLALEVFARSFFAHPSDFSGAELVAMFHTYFLGSSEGLLFDVPDAAYDRVLWEPLGRYLHEQGGQIRTGARVCALRESAVGDGPNVTSSKHDRAHGRLEVVVADPGGDDIITCDAVVLATDVASVQHLVAGASWLGDDAWRAAVAGLRVAPPFAVWRMWLDSPVRAGSPPFLGTAGYGELDNVSCVHLFEDEAARWAAATGGSVVELHAYAIDHDVDVPTLRRSLRQHLERLHPELTGARVVHEEWLVEADCPLVTPDPWQDRPGVETPDPRVVLAGDGIRCDLPVALMERAATTGIMAADLLLARRGLTGEGVWSVPLAGVLRPVARRGPHPHSRQRIS
ncbi:MAG: NAD(P)/FAD-dependent oxidoreductase [Dermatophilaceae bacterium]